MLLVLAHAHLALGDPDQAGALTERMIDHARAQRKRKLLADALYVQALIDAQQGWWEGAERAAEVGLALVRCMPFPYAEAGLRHVLGTLQAGQGQVAAAREALGAALATFRRLGATMDGDQAARDLVGLR